MVSNPACVILARLVYSSSSGLVGRAGMRQFVDHMLRYISTYIEACGAIEGEVGRRRRDVNLSDSVASSPSNVLTGDCTSAFRDG